MGPNAKATSSSSSSRISSKVASSPLMTFPMLTSSLLCPSFLFHITTSSLHKSCPMHQHQRTSQYSMQYPYRYWNQTQANQHFYVATSSNDDAIRVVCKSKIASNEILLPPLHIPKRYS